MQANSHGNDSRSGSQLIPISAAAKLAGVHQMTLRRAANARELRVFVRRSGHRRFRVQDVLDWAGLSDGHDTTRVDAKPAIYIRVSSVAQSRAKSDARQRERLIKAVSKREKCKPKEILIYHDVASAFGQRKDLCRLVDDCIAGNKIGSITIEYADRFSRVPALTRLLEHLTSSRNIPIHVLEQEQKNPDDIQEAMLELVNYTQVIGARLSGRKGGQLLKKTLSEGAIERARELEASGLSLVGIVKVLKKEGHYATDGSGKRGVIRRGLLYKLLHSDAVKAVMPKVPPTRSSFDRFVSARVVKARNGKVQATELYQAYRKFCKDQKEEIILSKHSMRYRITKKYKWRRIQLTQVRYYSGVRLKRS